MADAFCPQPITISAILSYCGSALDVGLNYSLLAINIAGFVALYKLSSEAPLASSSSHPRPSLGSTLLSVGFVIAFQIVLCLIVECVGISIVWCAILGWILLEFACGIGAASNGAAPARQPESSNASSTTTATTTTIGGCWCRCGNLNAKCSSACIATVSTILLDSVVIVYYALTAPAITTVAHLCAILMGMMLEVVAVRGCFIGVGRRFVGWEESPSAESSTTPLLR